MTAEYPVYVKWRYITAYMLDICGKFPKNVRFNMADRLTNISLDIIELIVEAIYSRSRLPILRKTNLGIEKIRSLLQICMDKKYLSLAQYEHLAREINEAGKMVGGWIKSAVPE
jgi:hypothetical protein